MKIFGFARSKFILPNLVVLLFFLYFGSKVSYSNFFVSDHLVKLAQSHGLIESFPGLGEFPYPAKELDEDYSLNPYLLWLHKTNFGIQGAFPITISIFLAPMIRYLGNESVYFFSLLIFLCLISYMAYSGKYSLREILLLLFCSSLFWHMILFWDVAIALLILFYLVQKWETLFESSKYEISLFSIMVVILYTIRPEYFIFFLLYVGIKFRYQKVSIKQTNFYFFIVCLLCLISIWTFWNLKVYGNPMGIRYLANNAGVFQDLSYRVATILSLFIGNQVRLGFFGFMPYFLFFIVLLIYKLIKKSMTDKKDEANCLVVLSYFFIMAVISPNDSLIDWGSRYLTPALLFLPSFKSLVALDRPFLKWTLYTLFFYSFLVNIILAKLLLNNGKQVQLQKDFLVQNPVELLVLRNPMDVSYLGEYYLKRKVIVSPKENDRELQLRLRAGTVKSLGFYFTNSELMDDNLWGDYFLKDQTRNSHYQLKIFEISKDSP